MKIFEISRKAYSHLEFENFTYQTLGGQNLHIFQESRVFNRFSIKCHGMRNIFNLGYQGLYCQTISLSNLKKISKPFTIVKMKTF